MILQPRFYSRKAQGLPPIRSEWGPLGVVRVAALHHSAGPRATSKARCIELNKRYNEQHREQWPRGGGIGYHLALDDYGRLYELRPKALLGAHVGLANTGNFGILVHGNYGSSSGNDKLTWLQRRTLKRLYRGDVKRYRFLGSVSWFGHQEFKGHAGNECPGTDQMRYLRWLRSKPR